MMFDYLVRERTLHNLIWVYGAARSLRMNKSRRRCPP